MWGPLNEIKGVSRYNTARRAGQHHHQGAREQSVIFPETTKQLFHKHFVIVFPLFTLASSLCVLVGGDFPRRSRPLNLPCIR